MARAGAAGSIQGKGGAWGEVVLPAVPPAGPGVDAVDVIFVSLAVAGSYEYVNGGRVRWRADSGGSWYTNSDRIRVIGSRSRGEHLSVWEPVKMLHMLKKSLTLEACGSTMA